MGESVDYSKAKNDFTSPHSISLSNAQPYDWSGTLARIQLIPDECKAVGVEGRTPLHVACDHDAPAEVVESILQAYPSATLLIGTSDMNPLHMWKLFGFCQMEDI
jgi:hypothetical protein